MKILLKYPSRSRKDWFINTLSLYRSMLSGNNPYEFRITMDVDDPSMNNASVRGFLADQPNLTYYYGHHRSKVEAINADMSDMDWDILILVSDDMIPMEKGFDQIIVDLMQEHFPDTDGALHFNDGLYGQDVTITLSIMGRKLYQRFNYIYAPEYYSFWCDNEFTDAVRELKKVHYDPRVIIKHDWKGFAGSDALYKRNSGLGRADADTYQRRKGHVIPV
jgi:hypothetical protein